MLQSEIVVVLLIFIPRSYKSQNSYIGLDLVKIFAREGDFCVDYKENLVKRCRFLRGFWLMRFGFYSRHVRDILRKFRMCLE